MLFSKLSQYFQKLESTASRNSMVEILAGLFGEASADEIDKIAYLTQGRVAPLYEPVEFQMADKMVVRALASAFNIATEEATRLYKQSGDLGTTAEALTNKANKTIKSIKARSSVEEVFLKLKLITETSGEGSVEKKVQMLADIFNENDAVSNRFLARIPVDKMRLGFSDMTILEGLSWMLDGTKKHKDKIETAYNIRPDLGYICHQVKKHGTAGIEQVKPQVGTPIMVMRAERLTSPEEILEKCGGKVAIEPKLDGLRTQLHIRNYGDRSKNYGKNAKDSSMIHNSSPIIRMYSRGMENVTAMYPELVEAARKLEVEDVILDGEAIAVDPKTGKYLPFQETVQRKRKYDVDLFSQDKPLKLVTFDCLYLNGKSLIDEAYVERRKIVERLLGENRTIVPVEMEVFSDPRRIDKKFNELVAKGLEGIMAKKLDGTYQAGARGWNWIKFKKSYESKLADTIDAVVMGYDFGQGKRNTFGVGSFLVGVYDKKTDSYKTVSKVGTGLTDEEWRTLVESGRKLVVSKKPANYDVNKLMNCDVWLKPKLIGVFLSDELTKSPMHTAGFAMRFPRLERWRNDKQPEDSTSLSEIEKMAL